tara:strand:- start:104 stop:382 length:279 start_codon:yes stop_codon:yes gene_type:complete
MQWQLIREMKFFSDKSSEYVKLEKGNTYLEVSYSHLSRSSKHMLDRQKRNSLPSERFVILNAEGKQRIFVVGKDVIPHSRGVEGLWMSTKRK